MISEREKNFLIHWKKKREMGRWKFCLVHGILFWAIPVYAFIQLFYYLFRDGYTFETGRFLAGLVAWMVIGFFGFGLAIWWLNERAYQKINMKNPDA